MPKETSYTYARDHLRELLDVTVQDRDVVIIHRRGHEDVALVAASELAGLLETAHLLRAPRNARRLLDSLRRALDGEGAPQSIQDLEREMGLETTDDGAA